MKSDPVAFLGMELLILSMVARDMLETYSHLEQDFPSILDDPTCRQNPQDSNEILWKSSVKLPRNQTECTKQYAERRKLNHRNMKTDKET